jgi:hypothetical protein
LRGESRAYIGAMLPLYPVTVEIEGRTYSGHWQLRQGGKLCVGWGFTSKVVDLDGERPEGVARRELPKLIRAWERDQERSALKLRREELRLTRLRRPRRPRPKPEAGAT